MKLGILDPCGQAQAGIKEVINECGDDIDGHCPLARCLALAAADVVRSHFIPPQWFCHRIWWWISAHGGGFQPEYSLSSM
jgi:hypothetical protein